MYQEYSMDNIKVEVINDNDEKVILNISACHSFINIKPEKVLDINNKEELLDLLLNNIFFEDLERALNTELETYSLKEILNYIKQADESDDLPINITLRKVESNFDKFNKELNDQFKTIIIHQIHISYEDNDFMDYINCPFEEDEETIREYLENSLSKDSEIDNIMQYFDFGQFYINHYEADERMVFDLVNKKFEKSLTVTNIE